MDETTPEHWLPVVGYEGLYEVSDLGRIYSIPRPGVRGGMLRPTSRNAYLCVGLSRAGSRTTPAIHVLVARAFLGPRPDGQYVCHGPAGPRDNSVANLSYGTPAKNCGPDRYRDDTILIGTRAPIAKLTDEIVRECRIRVAAGEPKAALAREFGVSKTAIIFAVRGTTWKHVA